MSLLARRMFNPRSEIESQISSLYTDLQEGRDFPPQDAAFYMALMRVMLQHTPNAAFKARIRGAMASLSYRHPGLRGT